MLWERRYAKPLIYNYSQTGSLFPFVNGRASSSQPNNRRSRGWSTFCSRANFSRDGLSLKRRLGTSLCRSFPTLAVNCTRKTRSHFKVAFHQVAFQNHRSSRKTFRMKMSLICIKIKSFCTKTRFETEAKSNSEMTYWRCFFFSESLLKRKLTAPFVFPLRGTCQRVSHRGYGRWNVHYLQWRSIWLHDGHAYH